MRSIASLVQINRHARAVDLRGQQSAIYDAIAELERAAERIDDLINEREQARDYAQAAALAARDFAAPSCYRDIRGA